MPKLGETVTEGVVSQWLKQPGDTIAFDDPLFEVSTDKVDSEVPSPYDGVLLEILVNEGDTVPVGTPIARIGEPGAATPTAAAPDAAAPESSEPATGPAAVPLPQAGNGQAGVPLSPVVRRLAAENDIDLSAGRTWNRRSRHGPSRPLRLPRTRRLPASPARLRRPPLPRPPRQRPRRRRRPRLRLPPWPLPPRLRRRPRPPRRRPRLWPPAARSSSCPGSG